MINKNKFIGILGIFILVLTIIPIVYGAESTLDNEGIFKKTGNFFKEKVIGSTVINKTRDVLGLDEGAMDFFAHLGTGIMIGLWIWATFLLAYFSAKYIPHLKAKGIGVLTIGRAGDMGKLRRSWLMIVGSRWWKIFIIAIIYAVLMMFPFINPFIDTISLKFLGLNGFFRSFLLALYVGLIPTVVEEYARYKIKKKWDMRIEEAKQQKRYVREVAKG